MTDTVSLLTSRPRRRRASPPAARFKAGDSKIGLALAGGGPLGVTYEIGALNALAESLAGIDFNDLGVYVGVSAGSVLAAGLANGIAPRDICRLFIEGESAGGGLEAFDPAILLQPAGREYARRFRELPRVASQVLRSFSANPGISGWSGAVARLGELLPTGLFDNSNIDVYLRRLFELPGRTNDFRKLRSRLILVATDLDSGDAVEFGSNEFAFVPISRAVQASTALPLLFPPVTIAGRNYVDGALTKTMHASGAYHAGARLVISVNPLVPYDATALSPGPDSHRALLPGGLPMVLSQTFRALIHSRMQASFARYANELPGLDIIRFEPDRSDADLFFTNIFSYASRRRVCEHAYQRTRSNLWKRREALAPILARHGVTLRLHVLQDTSRTLVPGPPPRIRPAPAVVWELEAGLRTLREWLAAQSSPIAV
ncbi:MAG: patatin-like phospholipase family protein [Betaproteobacteria bacterium]